MGEIRRVAQQRIEVPHHRDDGLGLARALTAVFDGEQRRDHLVNMAAVLGKKKFGTSAIIILFHSGTDSRGPPKSRNNVPFGQNTSDF